LTGSAERFSLHRTAVADALALAAALRIPLPEIVFYGVQPGRIGWGEALSPEVVAALPKLLEMIMAECNVSGVKRETSNVPRQASSSCHLMLDTSRFTFDV
jgi:Ni,Fe-hydrogenase maturation factor